MGLRHDRESDEEYDEDCVKEALQLCRTKLERWLGRLEVYMSTLLMSVLTSVFNIRDGADLEWA